MLFIYLYIFLEFFLVEQRDYYKITEIKQANSIVLE